MLTWLLLSVHADAELLWRKYNTTSAHVKQLSHPLTIYQTNPHPPNTFSTDYSAPFLVHCWDPWINSTDNFYSQSTYHSTQNLLTIYLHDTDDSTFILLIIPNACWREKKSSVLLTILSRPSWIASFLYHVWVVWMLHLAEICFGYLDF